MQKHSEPIYGSIQKQLVKCNRFNCRCMRRGELHLAYYRFWREDGKLFKRYVKKGEVAAMRLACEAGNRARREVAKRQRTAERKELRTFLDHLNRLNSSMRRQR